MSDKAQGPASKPAQGGSWTGQEGPGCTWRIIVKTLKGGPKDEGQAAMRLTKWAKDQGPEAEDGKRPGWLEPPGDGLLKKAR